MVAGIIGSYVCRLGMESRKFSESTAAACSSLPSGLCWCWSPIILPRKLTLKAGSCEERGVNGHEDKTHHGRARRTGYHHFGADAVCLRLNLSLLACADVFHQRLAGGHDRRTFSGPPQTDFPELFHDFQDPANLRRLLQYHPSHLVWHVAKRIAHGAHRLSSFAQEHAGDVSFFHDDLLHHALQWRTDFHVLGGSGPGAAGYLPDADPSKRHERLQHVYSAQLLSAAS